MLSFEKKLAYVSILAECINAGALQQEKGFDTTAEFKLYRIGSEKILIGGFSFTTLPGCCGVVVSHNTWLTEQTKHSGVSDPFRELKEEIAIKCGYSMMIATTDMSKVPSVGNMIKSKYNIFKTFTNKRTNHLLGIGYKLIQDGETRNFLENIFAI